MLQIDSDFQIFVLNLMLLQTELGEKDPASDKIYLPYQRKKAYWDMALVEAKITHPDYDWDSSRTLFNKIWIGTKNVTSKFKELVIYKNPPVSKCKVCEDSYEQLMTVKTKEELQEVRRIRSTHFQEVREERKIYHAHKKSALASPQEFASLNVDGMDQAKTAVPYANGKRDRDSTQSTTQARVIAVVIHGVGTACYIAPADIPHTADTTMTVLMDAFHQLEEKIGVLPPHLYLQMDNTNADNKTHTLLAWASALVQAQVFWDVELSFLPVGHTHADVDQKFSNIANYLGANPCHTFHELAVACQKALPNDCIYSVVLKRHWIINFKRFWDPTPQQKNYNKRIFAGSRDTHGFRFDRRFVDHDGIVRLFTKEWLRYVDWIPSLENLSLKLPATLYVVPPMPLPFRELNDVIKSLKAALNVGISSTAYNKNFDNISDDSDASTDVSDHELESFPEVLPGRWAARRKPTLQTLDYWLKIRRRQRQCHQNACSICMNLTSQRFETTVKRSLPDELRKLNKSKQSKLIKELEEHLPSCPQDLTINEDICGGSWKYYAKLMILGKSQVKS